TNPGTDFFAGLNTLAIVVGVPVSALAPSGGADMVQKAYVSTARVGGAGITRALNGAWWDANNPGEGWTFATYRAGDDLRIASTFYTFDTNGERYWLQGDGLVDGNGAVMDMHVFTGGSFGMALPPGTVTGVSQGTATVTFDSCSSGS